MAKGSGPNSYAEGRHGKGRLFQRGRVWWIQYYAHGQQVRESSRSKKKGAAERKLMEKLVAADAGELPLTRKPLTYEEMRQRLVTDRIKKGNVGNSETGLAPLDEAFKGLAANVIAEDRINELIIAQQKTGKANDTINGYLRALRRMFRLSWRDVKTPPNFRELMLPSSPARQGFLSRQQYLRLSAALPEHVRPIFAFGYYTGMREGELKNLTWRHVDLVNGIIRLESEDTKNNDPREIPFGVIPELAKLVKQLWQRSNGSEHVFNRPAGKPLGALREPLGSYRKAWIRACIKAGIETKTGLSRMVWYCQPCRRQREAEKRSWPPELPPGDAPLCESCNQPCRWKYCGLIFHDLRRTGARNLRRAGVPESVAMTITGHKTRDVFERYNIKDRRDGIEAMEKLANFHLAEDQRLETSTRTQ